MTAKTVDVLVVGSSAAGLAAAATATQLQLSTLLIKQTDKIGGITAYSSGTVWIPRNKVAQDDRKGAQAAGRCMLDLMPFNAATLKAGRGDLYAAAHIMPAAYFHNFHAFSQPQALEIGFKLELNTALKELKRESGAMPVAVVELKGGERSEIYAQFRVVLITSSFMRCKTLHKEHLPHVGTNGQIMIALFELGKPYCIVVDGQGRQVFAEADLYSESRHALYKLCKEGWDAWLMVDAAYCAHYALRMLAPRMDLSEAVFSKGNRAYHQFVRDAQAKQPNLGTIAQPPFYAVALQPGDVGTRGRL
ncbi:hypothetical protein CKAH01_18842 [Colletotrichum kahawae]|uniref:FAD-dependent oxidoreductase 2 FAD-binding domain-containing protein n=1 Tax=Colletotrichum kahawae TaxID=34407 RepID=A0AAD9Y5J4_COLKA|nr:hypothetical protein CKAH01_18842 [Colletotrichum kahawae]